MVWYGIKGYVLVGEVWQRCGDALRGVLRMRFFPVSLSETTPIITIRSCVGNVEVRRAFERRGGVLSQRQVSGGRWSRDVLVEWIYREWHGCDSLRDGFVETISLLSGNGNLMGGEYVEIGGRDGEQNDTGYIRSGKRGGASEGSLVGRAGLGRFGTRVVQRGRKLCSGNQDVRKGAARGCGDDTIMVRRSRSIERKGWGGEGEGFVVGGELGGKLSFLVQGKLGNVMGVGASHNHGCGWVFGLHFVESIGGGGRGLRCVWGGGCGVGSGRDIDVVA
ncbi:hypothetical protein Tco_0542606 [Tanacetum coccineum]